jgi:hypothetical protein
MEWLLGSNGGRRQAKLARSAGARPDRSPHVNKRHVLSLVERKFNEGTTSSCPLTPYRG